MSVQAWFFVVVACVVVELLTGTLFLLLIGLSALVGLFVASLGYGVVQQTSCAFLCGFIFLMFLWSRRVAKPSLLSPADFNQGEHVQVIRWVSKSRARVFYRGTEWDAELMSRSSARNENQQIMNNDIFFVHHLEGSVLFITDLNSIHDDPI